MKRKIALAALLMAAALAMTGCGFSLVNYGHGEMYPPGDASIAEPVNGLDIHWQDGEVTIAYADQAQVTLSETAKQPLTAAEQVHWWLDGGILRIQYAQAGFLWTNDLDKRLTVTLPTGTVLKSARIACTSGSIQAAPFYGETVELSVTSGTVHTECAASALKLMATSGSVTVRGAAKTVDLRVTSGHIDAAIEHADQLTAALTSGTIQLQAQADSVSLNATSGSVSAVIPSADAFSASVTSGDLLLDLDQVRQANVHTTSGKIDLRAGHVSSLRGESSSGVLVARCANAPDEISLSSFSGALSLFLPRSAGFSAQISTASGNTNLGLPARKDGNRYIAGDGAAKIVLSTTSGSITLNEYRE